MTRASLFALIALTAPLHAAAPVGRYAAQLRPGMTPVEVTAALRLSGSPSAAASLIQTESLRVLAAGPALAVNTGDSVMLIPMSGESGGREATVIDLRSADPLPKTIAVSAESYAGALALFDGAAKSEGDAVVVPDQLVADGLPQIPQALARGVGQYLEARGAGFSGWHPLKKRMLILTRFADTAQIHEVKSPGGDRRQLTFFKDPVDGAGWEPTKGEFMVYAQNVGGSEANQLYRFDPETGKSTLLTDGKSRNGFGPWSADGRFLFYTSDRRTGADNDVYMVDPRDPSTGRRVAENSGGGWSVEAVSPDGKSLLLSDYISANESRLFLLDIASGKRERLAPREGERVSYDAVVFAKDGRSLIAISDGGGEFKRLVRIDLKSKKEAALADHPWNVERFSVSADGKKIAYATNEAGASVLRVISAKTGKLFFAPKLPLGVIGGLSWHKDGKTLAYSFTSAKSAGDVYTLDLSSRRVRRWTRSETGGLNAAHFREPELVTINSFDGERVSGFLYRPDAKRFPGPRPTVINIHGGPEGQSRPNMVIRNNYLVNELGIAVFYPNVRGSTGYGRRFLDLDNGYKREDSVKDIGAFIDWIKSQPGLDGERIAVMGGSYGGYMTLASLVHYGDKLVGGIDTVGISDFVTFLENTSPYRRDLRRVEYGDERDPEMRAFLKRISPLTNVERIQKPLFVVQGQNDPRVPVGEAEQIVAAVRQKGREAWYLLGKNEGHGFARKANIDFLFLAVITFLSRYLLATKTGGES